MIDSAHESWISQNVQWEMFAILWQQLHFFFVLFNQTKGNRMNYMRVDNACHIAVLLEKKNLFHQFLISHVWTLLGRNFFMYIFNIFSYFMSISKLFFCLSGKMSQRVWCVTISHNVFSFRSFFSGNFMRCGQLLISWLLFRMKKHTHTHTK